MVRYLQLAHNERHPQTGNSVAKVIHNFGRADQVDRDGPGPAGVIDLAVPHPGAGRGRRGRGGEVEMLDSRRLGGAWTLDRLWERLGIGAAIRRVAAGRRLDGETVERVVFALVAQRALEPGSKLAATRWVAERVAIDGLPGVQRRPGLPGDGLPARRARARSPSEIFSAVAHLLNLDLDIVFVDTTSTYWEIETADD